jgi:hypothetical protein
MEAIVSVSLSKPESEILRELVVTLYKITLSGSDGEITIYDFE